MASVARWQGKDGGMVLAMQEATGEVGVLSESDVTGLEEGEEENQ